MALSRLDNLIKNVEGNLLYVNPNDLDATDSILNQGNSLTRPFKTLQRALIEAARFSYLSGSNNDKFDRTTIILYPGEYFIDNRPGYSVYDNSGSAVFQDVNGNTIGSYLPTGLTESSNLDINSVSNLLYTFNSINGGVILPRGTSIVGLDLRKTKIRPLYVPDPEDNSISESNLFNLTGSCYFTQFTIFDASPTGFCYKNTTGTKYAPLFSHHKLTGFGYADGKNKVVSVGNGDLTDLQMYYYKIAQAFGVDSGRSIGDFPGTDDFEPKVDEYRIVGEVSSEDISISTIVSGDGVVGTTVITVTTTQDHGLQVDSPISVVGVTQDANIYNGSFVVATVPATNQFTYVASSIPTVLSPTFSNGRILVESDTVSSSSPYVFNCTLRSVYGMNGMHADGSKALGFKSMLVSQFTGVSLQKDDNSFLIYDNGIYRDQVSLGSSISLHTDSNAIYKPDYESYHIKVSNSAYIQAVCIFAIGFTHHFVTETGGDISITNSNSNFGSLALKAIGFKDESFDRDDTGYITHIIPPKEIQPEENNISWLNLDTTSIINAGIGNTEKLYLDGFTDVDSPPLFSIDSYKVGARVSDKLYLNISQSGITSVFSSPIVMEGSSSEVSEKSYYVDRVGASNNIISNETIVLTTAHTFTTGEKVIVVAENGDLPDGLEFNTIYYVITTGTATQIKLAESFNNSTAAVSVPINNIQTNGGKLRIVSRVSDKLPGEYGHPIQFDSTNSKWYLKSTVNNEIRSAMVSLGSTIFNDQSPISYFKRKEDNRSLTDRTYRVRYVIPKEFTSARIPSEGYVLQESKSVSINSGDETGSITDVTRLRNQRVIATASWSSNVVTVRTEQPHNLQVGNVVRVTKVTSTNNATGVDFTGFNGRFTIVSVPTSKTFTYSLTTNPGTFTNDVTVRDSNLPVVSRNKLNDILSVYRIETIQSYIPSKRDGVYHLTLVGSNASPTVSEFTDVKLSQPIRYLYPSEDRDNYNSDPQASSTFALNSLIGKTVVNDPRNSITKESINSLLKTTNVAIAVTSVTSVGYTATVNTGSFHGLNPINTLTLVSGGTSSYTVGRNVQLSSSGNGQGATIHITGVSGGSITSWVISDPGSGYASGETLTASSNGSGDASFTVASIRNDVGKVVTITGVTTTGYGGENNSYNGVFRVSSISGPNQLTIGIATTGGTYSSGGALYVCDNSVGITSIIYNSTTGIATVSTGSTSIGIPASARFNIIDAPQTQFNGSYLVKSRVGLSTITVYFGEGLTLPTYTGGAYIAKNLITSHGENTSSSDENLSSRLIPIYGKHTVNLSTQLSSSSTSIGLSTSIQLRRGDFVQINDEILRLTDNPSAGTVTVLRGVMGTRSAVHNSGSEVKKLNLLPIELRRPSFVRSSNHTFEYMGFGPGNYSTALPQRQNRVLTKDEQLISQKKSESGGSVVYTGMNDSGDFYIGNRRLSPSTSQEETFDSPIFELYGEISAEKKLSAIYDDITVRDRIKIEGGSSNTIRSEFNGPVIFSQKITSTSTIETNKISIKGNSDTPNEISVGTTTPTNTGKLGDIVLYDEPLAGQYLGWVWSDGWKRFSPISTDRDSMSIFVDKIGLGVTDFAGRTIRTLGAAEFGTTKVANLYVTGVTTFATPITFSSITANDFVINGNASVAGIATIGFLTTTNAYLGVVTSNYANLTNISVGIATIGFATITASNVGIATVGFATITNAFIGVQTSTTINSININSQNVSVASSLTINGPIYLGNNTGSSGQVLVSQGIGSTPAWQNASATSVGSATAVAITSTSVNQNYFITFVGEIIGNADLRNDPTGLSYNPSTNKLGIGTNTPLSTIQVNDVYGTDTTNVDVATTSTTNLVSLSTSVFRSAKFLIQITQGSNYHFVEIAAIHNGTTVSFTEYNQITTGSSLANLSMTVSGGNMILQTTQGSATSATYKIVTQTITI